MLLRAWVLVTLCGTVAWARPAEDPKVTETKEHYERGLARFNLQEFKDAIVEFEAAYRLKPDPVFLYNLAQAHRLSENVERALYFYRAYLRASPSAPNRSEVEGRITALEKLIAEKKNVATPPDHALSPADKPPTSATAAPVVTQPVAAPSPAPALEARKDVPAPSERRVPVYKKWWLWTVVAGVAVGAGLGIGLGLGLSPAKVFDANLGTTGPSALTGGN